MTLVFTPEQLAARDRLEAGAAEYRRQTGRRKLTPEEKAANLAKLRARAEARDEGERREREEREERRATGRWRELGLELDELPVDDPHPGDAGLDALARLFLLIEQHRPAWQRDALCQEYPDLPWFPERGERVDECKAVCERCAVAEECRLYAAENDISAGCWGGVVGRGLLRLKASEQPAA